jgi:hypothetical protein
MSLTTFVTHLSIRTITHLPPTTTKALHANMKPTTFATLITLLGSASANCYNPNFPPAWFNRDEAQWHVNRACRGYDGNSGAFQGVFGPGETKYVCIDCPDNRDCKLEFSIQNENYGASFDLGDDDCATKLGNEIWGCSNGGESSVSGWHFRYVGVYVLLLLLFKAIELLGIFTDVMNIVLTQTTEDAKCLLWKLGVRVRQLGRRRFLS